jgi:CBS domain containing-hemolysin-like protein
MAVFTLQLFCRYRPLGGQAGWEPLVATVTGTLLLVFSAELIAKGLFVYLDVYILKFSMPLLKLARYTLFWPLLEVVRRMESRFEEWHRRHDHEDDVSSAEDEILSLVETGHAGDHHAHHLEEDEKRMIKGIFELNDTPVREIMTPRVDVKALPMNASITEARQMFVASGHSRIPVYQDNIDKIKGIIYAKDFLDERITGNENLEKLCHKPFFIPKIIAVGELLKEIKKNRNHFAVVIDEYGGTSGIITFEDIIEEIVGDVLDEYDTEEDGGPKPEKLADGSVIIPGRTLICDVNELLGTELPEDDDVDTIGGFVCGAMGKIPEPNETTVLGRVRATVLKADKRKIISLKLQVIGENNV